MLDTAVNDEDKDDDNDDAVMIMMMMMIMMLLNSVKCNYPSYHVYNKR